MLKTLLDKLELIRRELKSDKVFDVVGRLFEGVSLREYLGQALTETGADTVSQRIEGTLTTEQVTALEEREKRLYGDGGDVKSQLPEQEAQLEQERWRRLLEKFGGTIVRTVEKKQQGNRTVDVVKGKRQLAKNLDAVQRNLFPPPDVDQAWHVRAWGWWVLQLARADLERFYPVVTGDAEAGRVSGVLHANAGDAL